MMISHHSMHSRLYICSLCNKLHTWYIILLSTIWCQGLSLLLLKSYRHNWIQAVKIGNRISKASEVRVPTGIDTQPFALIGHGKLVQYADDTTFQNGKLRSELERGVFIYLNSCTQYFNNIHHKITSQTNVISFSVWPSQSEHSPGVVLD